MEEFTAWDYKSPGISFSAMSGRITLFKTTLAALDYPEYYRFLFNPESQMFAMQICGIDDDGAHRLPKADKEGRCEIKSIALVRFVYHTCGWKKRNTYRIPGKVCLEERLVSFDLSEALGLYQGRLLDLNV